MNRAYVPLTAFYVPALSMVSADDPSAASGPRGDDDGSASVHCVMAAAIGEFCVLAPMPFGRRYRPLTAARKYVSERTSYHRSQFILIIWLNDVKLKSLRFEILNKLV